MSEAIDQKLRALKFAEPFAPFELILRDGQRHAVEQADAVGWHLKADALSVALPDDSFQHLKLSDVQDVRPLPLAEGAFMTVEQLRRYLRTQPFRPFFLYLPDGRYLAVAHPELLLFSKSGRTIDVFSSSKAFETVDVLLIVSLRQLTDSEQQYQLHRL